MHTLKQSLHFSQHSWLNPVRQLQMLRRDWEAGCAALGVAQGQLCDLSWERPELTVQCSAALAARLRQIAPDLTQALLNQGWGEVAIQWVVTRSAATLKAAWNAQQTPWVNPNITRLGPRTRPSKIQGAALVALHQRLLRQG